MLNAQFRPLEKWPGERTKVRKDAQFRAGYNNTLDLLEHELGKLQARGTIVQVDNLAPADIRNDGWPRAGWQPRGGWQGVIVSFESPKGAMSFPCDRYVEWRDNLRAIALSLEALRTVDRYGVTRGNEQYRGWAKLEAPGSNGKMDRHAAADFLATLTGLPRTVILVWEKHKLQELCRSARINNHPDRGGSHETFVAIGEAEKVLCG